ncbi:metal-sensitive transcriptional regulator [Brachybacterium sp. UMB0905]|uniref:metal-sensitive transcriptional regulator n=1 Tax=Brachybacterium sp. UMB0905 TaxID=2069310 RepID=UPI0026A126BB
MTTTDHIPSPAPQGTPGGPDASAAPITSDACCAATGEHHHGYISDKSRYLARLKRIEGQARGLHRMVDEEKYCIDILTQISALKSALDSVAMGLLDDHLQHCVLDAARSGGDAGEEKLKEASAAIARLVRS